MENFQRTGSISNAHVGKEFEKNIAAFFLTQGLELRANYTVPIGIEGKKKAHKFDLGTETPKVIVECKSHTWTSGNNVPSAKITVWNEAMYYFTVSPEEYRKIFCVLRHVRSSSQETLAEYYIRINGHLIPSDVEIWEYDPIRNNAMHLNGET